MGDDLGGHPDEPISAELYRALLYTTHVAPSFSLRGGTREILRGIGMRAGLAADRIAAIAHAVHGAVGISEEFDLQLLTRRLHAWRLADGSERNWSKRLGEKALDTPGHAALPLAFAAI